MCNIYSSGEGEVGSYPTHQIVVYFFNALVIRLNKYTSYFASCEGWFALVKSAQIISKLPLVIWLKPYLPSPRKRCIIGLNNYCWSSECRSTCSSSKDVSSVIAMTVDSLNNITILDGLKRKKKTK